MNGILNIFQTITLASSIIIAIWLFDRVTGKRTGYIWRKVLWLVLAVRLLVPMPIHMGDIIDSFQGVQFTVDISEQFSVLPAANKEVAVENSAVTNTENTMLTEAGNASLEKNEGKMMPSMQAAGAERKIPVAGIIATIWAMGAVFALCFRYCQYRFMKKKYLNASYLCEDSEIKRKINHLCGELGIKKECSCANYQT